MITGFVTGKFCPFHKGHMALIDYAKANCDNLIIFLVANSKESIPYKYRLKWILSTYLDDPQVEVHGDIIDEPNLSGDELSKWWGNYCAQRFGKIDRIFTSEDYGEMFSQAAGAENWVFDKARTIVPVSATIIRNRPLTNWDYLNNFAKDYFVKKIAIVGTESTGKTTMCQQLAEHYKTVWVPEVGRELIPNSNNFSLEDLKIVGVEHAKNILRHTRLANKLLFIDTELITTKSYAKFFFNEVPKYEPWVEAANKIDYYIYLEANAPYINDGTRLSKEKRDKLDKEHYKLFERAMFENNASIRHISYYDNEHYIGKTDPYEHRLQGVIGYIDYLVSKF